MLTNPLLVQNSVMMMGLCASSVYASNLLPRRTDEVARRLFIRQPYSTLNHIPHAFDYEEASKRFAEEENKRLFAPIQDKEMKLPMLRVEDPLKQILFPFFSIKARVSSSEFCADYGYNRSETYFVNGKLHTRHWIEWRHMSGTLGETFYSADDPNLSDMLIDGGLEYPSYLLEDAFSGHKIYHRLQPFDEESVDDKIIVGIFKKRGVLAREEAIDRILSHENSRVRSYVYRKTCADHIEVKSLSTNHNLGKLSAHLLPGYIYQFNGFSPRVLPAIDRQEKVFGKGALSVVKCAFAGGLFAGSLAFGAPGLSIVARGLVFALGPVISGVYAKYRSSVTHRWDQATVRKIRESNEKIAESIADRRRRETTEKFQKVVVHYGELASVAAEHYLILGLNPKERITAEIVRMAYLRKVKEYHPDVYKKNDGKIHRVFAANRAFNTVFNKGQEDKAYGRRYFSSVARVIVEEPPRSVEDNRSGRLIQVVLREKNYRKALSLVVDEEISPDSHDADENTLLTQAAKEGDFRAVKFAVNELEASLDTSCDCPEHRTALHYASEYGHDDIVEFLLEKGANPNLINSRGETALDIASSHRHERIAQLIANHGGVKHLSEGGVWRTIRGFFGYSSGERTRLLLPSREKEEKEKLP